MKKIILTAVFLATGLMTFAQVGIGTENPTTTLELVGANATDVGLAGANTPGAVAGTDGIMVPKVTSDMTDVSGDAAAGTVVGQLVFSINPISPGFYFWNGASLWDPLVGGGAAAPYQDIRGDVSTVTAATYTVLATDYAVITNHTAAVTITFPTLTAADAGRTLFVFNNNTGFFNNVLSGTIIGQPTLTKNRAMEFLWSGTAWFIIGK